MQTLFLASPTIIEEPSSTGVDILHNVTLDCVPLGVPQPAIHWKKADQFIAYNDHYYQLDNGALFIKGRSLKVEFIRSLFEVGVH